MNSTYGAAVLAVVVGAAEIGAQVGGCGEARADQTILYPSKDNSLYEPAGEEQLSNGAGMYLFVGVTGLGTKRRALVTYDLAGSLPRGSRIDTVQLEVTVSTTRVGGVTVGLHRMLADWGEGPSVASGGQGGGTAAEPGDVTWSHSFWPDVQWTNLGGDFDAEILATKSLSGEGSYQFESQELTDAVQDMLDDPAGNFGFVLIGGEGGGTTAKRLNSREFSSDDLKPRLIVEYTPGCVGDWNSDQGVDGDDVIAFFTDWDNNNADADESGSTDGDDVIFFFERWDNNCA